MSRRAPSLRREIVASFLLFAATLSLLFAASSFLVAFIVEDSLFEATLAEETARQRAHWRAHRRLAPTGREWISVHSDPNTFPADLRREFGRVGAREEYRGDGGRHYHVAPLALDGAPRAFVVAEVGERLAVRPLQGGLLTAIGLLSVAILLAAAGLGTWLARRSTAPLCRLVDTVSSGPADEVPSVSAADFPANEIGVLAATLEAMLERTRAFVERETRFTREASHELRTPIAVIRSSVELIESKGDVVPEVAGPLRRIADAAQEMERTVELLLMLAREERTRSISGPVALLPLVENAVVSESLACGGETVDVSIDVEPDGLTFAAADVVGAILGNLIRNAFQHASGGKLRIFVDGLDLVIADSGPDTNEAARPAHAGAGLGLEIVSRLCRLHAIAFALDAGPDGGTTARVRLLLA